MALYRCICCGQEKESEQPCNCSNCGYKMYELPFERKAVLSNEIKGFIRGIETEKYNPGLLYARGKEKDDERFPSLDVIENYILTSKKLNVFQERTVQSVKQIYTYLNTPFHNKYDTDAQILTEAIEARENLYHQALKCVDIHYDIPKLSLPEIELNYSETPNTSFVELQNQILGLLEQLVQKLVVFVKTNNVYSEYYYEKSKVFFNHKEEGDYSKELSAVIEKISRILNKKYILDLFSDGEEEQEEMTDALWLGLEAVLLSPGLVRKYDYCFENGDHAINDEFSDYISNLVCRGHESVNRVLFEKDLSKEYSEEDLFEIYDKMVKMDTIEYFHVNQFALRKIGDSERRLNSLVGLENVKESVRKFKAYSIINKGKKDLNLHMCFYGNPGTGKTEVARIIAGILYENNILPTDNVIEVDRAGLVSQYYGATAQKTMDVISESLGGVLFVDEAYALTQSGNASDYGMEAISTLIKAMEDFRGQFCVIFAGYRAQMEEMVSSNPGLKSRIQFELDFKDYSREELGQIARLMLSKREYNISQQAFDRMLDITDVKRKNPDFANAREIRNILDQAIMAQNLRTMNPEDREIGLIDIEKYIQTNGLSVQAKENDHRILTADEELNQLIGLESVKRTIKKIKAYAKRNQGLSDLNLHMCFYGNPGTGKTEVARILSRILYEAGVLKEGKTVETDASGLIGRVVGETATKTIAKVREAMGGVLFIDEAYALSIGSVSLSYGAEAISELLKQMEDHRGQLCVILAGYKNEMQHLLKSNPGFESRIQFTLEFPDYSRQELGSITDLMLSKKGYIITDDAKERLLDITDYEKMKPNYANARTLRNILDQVILNQNLRTEDMKADNQITIEDVEDYIADNQYSFR